MPEIKLNSLIGKSYRVAAYDIFQHGHTHYTFYGGRGSLKSSFVSLAVPLLIVANRQANALVLRKVSNTLRDSVFAQYQWALAELGIADYWTARLSPMELTYIPTGQKILFRGCDDPMKIKSITVPKGYIAVTHFEELDQFAGRAEVRNVLQSTMRGGKAFWNLESFNPPISRDNWANRDILEDRPDRLLTWTCYTDAPPEWLGQQFIDEAEWLKQTDERAYQHEYLGEAVGTGGNVFENLEIRDIMDEELQALERTYVGCDFGFFPDPFAAVWCKYDAARRALYVFDEIYAVKKTNEETAEMLKAHGVDRNQRVICDSAEPKSIADYRKYGLNAAGVRKGAGSVDRRMRWAQGLSKIVVDKRRCPNTARELLEYEYERTKDGEIVSGYPDAKNHCIDGLCYGCEPIWNRAGQTEKTSYRPIYM